MTLPSMRPDSPRDVSEQAADRAIQTLRQMIEAAENSNQAGENAVVQAAAGPDLYAALEIARKYLDLCLGAPTYDGPNPYPIIDAALARARGEP